MDERRENLAGTFIVIDGPDGAGKTTQIDRLARRLRDDGLTVRQVRDPGGTAIGDRIRHILLDKTHQEMSVPCEVMLYMASRAQLVSEIIRPALGRGECVLCDRYISATVAYQGAGGTDAGAIRTVGEVAVGGLWPDLTVVLDIDPELGLRRAEGRQAPDRMEARTLDFHRRVRALFLKQARDAPDRFVVVGAAGEVDDVADRVARAVAGFFRTGSF